MTDPALPLVVHDAAFREHRPPRPSHPERPERCAVLDPVLAARAGQLRVLAPRLATDDEILAAHERSYLEQLRRFEGQALWLDPDTYIGPRSVEIARLAAGGTVELALRIARGEARRGFALVRPPGHHAERGRGMGFCLLNHVALAARALAREGLERIAVVDWDVHHGNGTQQHFERERDVFFLSLHQFPFYPGTGSLLECGSGPGEGATVNLPLPAGCGDAEYQAVFDAVVLPCLAQFRPQLILVSAGFDAHERDPLAQMRVTSAGFRRLAAQLREAADALCQGRLLLALEGGYDLDALAQCVGEVLDELGGHGHGAPAPASSAAGEQLVALFRERHGAHWSSLTPRMRC